MSFSIPKLDKTQWALVILAFLFIAYVIFNEIRKSSWRKKLKSELESIDQSMTSGRASASELVDLNIKRKAILNQYLKTI